MAAVGHRGFPRLDPRRPVGVTRNSVLFLNGDANALFCHEFLLTNDKKESRLPDGRLFGGVARRYA